MLLLPGSEQRFSTPRTLSREWEPAMKKVNKGVMTLEKPDIRHHIMT